MRFGLLCACDSVDKLNWAIVQIIACATSINTFYFYGSLSCSFFSLLFVIRPVFVGTFFRLLSFNAIFFLLFSSLWFGLCRKKKHAFHALKCKQLTSLSINYQTSQCSVDFIYWPFIVNSVRPLHSRNCNNYIVCFFIEFWHKLTTVAIFVFTLTLYDSVKWDQRVFIGLKTGRW